MFSSRYYAYIPDMSDNYRPAVAAHVPQQIHLEWVQMYPYSRGYWSRNDNILRLRPLFLRHSMGIVYSRGVYMFVSSHRLCLKDAEEFPEVIKYAVYCAVAIGGATLIDY